MSVVVWILVSMAAVAVLVLVALGLSWYFRKSAEWSNRQKETDKREDIIWRLKCQMNGAIDDVGGYVNATTSDKERLRQWRTKGYESLDRVEQNIASSGLSEKDQKALLGELVEYREDLQQPPLKFRDLSFES